MTNPPALDTNILVRYIVRDDTAQACRADKVIEGLTPENPGFIAAIVLCELNWVLTAAYKLPKAERLEILKKILAVSEFEIEHLPCALKALTAYKTGKADFSDYFIKEIAARAGYAPLVTLDENALKSDGFSAPA